VATNRRAPGSVGGPRSVQATSHGSARCSGSACSPEAADGDLAAEEHAIEVVAFGGTDDLAAGATFSRSPRRARRRRRHPPARPPASPGAGELVARALGGPSASGHATRAKANEVTLPECRTRIEDDALIIDLPGRGGTRATRPVAGQGPAVSVFAGWRLWRPSMSCRAQPAAYVSNRYGDKKAGPTMDAPTATITARCRFRTAPACHPGLGANLSAPSDRRRRGTGLDLRSAARRRLSAGVASGDGSWLSPRDLELHPAPPRAGPRSGPRGHRDHGRGSGTTDQASRRWWRRDPSPRRAAGVDPDVLDPRRSAGAASTRHRARSPRQRDPVSAPTIRLSTAGCCRRQLPGLTFHRPLRRPRTSPTIFDFGRRSAPRLPAEIPRARRWAGPGHGGPPWRWTETEPNG
jgi:hypothetical protein